MPERTFFNVRYTVPGLTFVLLIVCINYNPILATLPERQLTFGAFVAFLSLLSGSAIGFVISQVWWTIWHTGNGNYGWRGKPGKPIRALQKKFGITKCPEDRAKAVVVLDYVLHAEDIPERLFDYRKRRWDTYHALSAQTTAILMGLGLGWLFRFLFIPYFEPHQLEPIILLVASLVFVIFAILTAIGARFDKGRYDAIAEVIIRELKLEKKELETIFPHDYFDISHIANIGKSDVEKLENAGICSVSLLAKADLSSLHKITAIQEEKLVTWIGEAKKFLND